MNFLKLRYDPDIGLPCAVMKTASNPTDLIKENMLCNNYTIIAKHLQFLFILFYYSAPVLHISYSIL